VAAVQLTANNKLCYYAIVEDRSGHHMIQATGF